MDEKVKRLLKVYLELDSESKRLLQFYKQNFEIAGANLSSADKEKLKQINQELASLSTQYSNKLLEARKQGEMIVLTFTGDERRKWVFTEIGENKFHWQNITIQENGDIIVNCEAFGKRK